MIQSILFDVDGVFLSEERCFDASALSVWELLHAPHFLGIQPSLFTDAPSEDQIQQIRNEVFQENRVLDWMKTRGINSNWDMVYLVFGAQLFLLLKRFYEVDADRVKQVLRQPVTEDVLLELRDWISQSQITFTPRYDQFIGLFQGEELEKHELLTYYNQLAEKWFGVSIELFSRNSSLWELGRSVYQEWYLGSRRYEQTEGEKARNARKQGFLEQEIPLADPEKIGSMLGQLKEQGITLGIGTGRPHLETEVPLETLGLYSYFDPRHIVSASDVIRAEEAYPDQAPLGKPHPYTYLKAYLGRETPDEVCFSTPLPLADRQKILIVGDSVADYLAAEKLGCRFAATLTGLTGKKARKKFEELQADYILDDVTQLISLLSDRAKVN